MSMPAETPALVMRSPSSTKRAATSVITVGSISESRFSDAQCVAAVLPFSRPSVGAGLELSSDQPSDTCRCGRVCIPAI